jgi:hypothetical protein
VLVPGFEPDGATLAALMGKEAAQAARAPRAEGPRREVPRREHARPVAKLPTDPIFSRPYEPGAPSAAPAEPAAAAPQQRRKERQVAALLGGLKRAG